MAIDPGAVQALTALAFGFALAGLTASAFELLTQHRASFNLLQRGGATAVACVPIVVLGAPFIILRNTMRGRRSEGRPMPFVMLATMIACGWSLMCGRVVLDLAHLVIGG